MSYRLLKLHWVQYRGSEKVKDFYSYHLSKDQVGSFVERFKHDVRNSEFHYSVGCRTFEKSTGQMHDRVVQSTFGIWDPREPKPV